MNKNQVEGRAEQAKGKIKELAGKMVGNQRLQGEGLAEQAEGKARAAYGNAKEAVKDGAKRVADKL
jgi:uncharacterized protein YjbJ (UPF0337 family)